MNLLDVQVMEPGGSGGHRRRGDPPRLGQEGKRKLTESAREFPKAFRLAEPVRVAPGGAGAPARPHHLGISLRWPICLSIFAETAVKFVSAPKRFGEYKGSGVFVRMSRIQENLGILNVPF